jgi:integrase
MVKCKQPENLIRNGRFVMEHFGVNAAVRDCTKLSLQEFAAELEDGGNSGGTINRKMAAASLMLREALEHGVIEAKPPIPRRDEGEGRLRYLEDHEETLLLSYWDMTSDPLNLHLSEFLIDTGARAFSEACQVRWEDITEHGVIFKGYDQRGTKNGTFRTIPLSDRAREACMDMGMMRGSNPDGPWFGIRSSQIRSQWDRMRTHTGLHDVTPHVLRHTCASRFAQDGWELLRIAKWLGHKTLVTTQRYTHLMPSSLDDMAAAQNRRIVKSGDQTHPKGTSR